MKEKRVFHDGLIAETEGGTRLIGRKCKKCGKIQFPQKGVCMYCLSDDGEDVLIGEHAKLFSFTTTYSPAANFQPPFTVGYLELPEGVRIFSQIREEEDVSLRIGMDMELELADLWEEEDAVVTGYRYKAARGGKQV